MRELCRSSNDYQLYTFPLDIVKHMLTLTERSGKLLTADRIISDIMETTNQAILILKGRSINKFAITKDWSSYLSSMYYFLICFKDYNPSLLKAEGNGVGKRRKKTKVYQKPLKMFTILPLTNFQQKHILLGTVQMHQILPLTSFYSNI